MIRSWLNQKPVYWLLSASLRVKVMGIVLGMILLLGLWITTAARASLREALTCELQTTAANLASDVAARVTDYLLTDNLYAVHRVLRDTVAHNEDVAYLLVLSNRGVPLAHTLGGSPSPALLTANALTDDQHVRLRQLTTSAGLMQDVAAPILRGHTGMVRLGMSERRVQAGIAATTRRLVLVTLLASAVGLFLSSAVTTMLVRPVLALVQVTDAVGKGDFCLRAEVQARDEIGQLAEAFNRMAASLSASQEELQRSHEQLLRQNRELAAVNAIAASVSQSLALEQVLSDALEQLLRSVEATGGQILLVSADGAKLVRRARRGQLPQCRHDDGEIEIGHGLAGRVFTTATTIVWPDCHQPPPVDGPEFRGRIIGVPLQAKGKVVGTLCLGTENEVELAPEDLDLLAAFGHQIGVAIENARLWQDLQQKELARTALLQQVITAQEDERKRVARELHDQTSQSLTSLMVGLRTLDRAVQSGAVRAQIRNLRTQLADTLDEVHRLSRELRPSALDDLGLIEALRRLAREFGDRIGLVVDCHYDALDDARFDAATETTVYRIVQEALTNIAKHAEARNVSVVLERREASLLAIVEDDGRGLDAADLDRGIDGGGALGLLGMRERAALLGGTLSIESEPGEGTTVYLSVPLEEPPHEETKPDQSVLG